MSEEIKETYLKLPNVTIGELQDVVDFMEDNDIEYIEFYEKDLKQQILDLQQKVEQLENIRKEAIEYINNNNHIDGCLIKWEVADLLNILNKGGGYLWHFV